MGVDQLPGRVREFARYLNGLLGRLDQGGGWCAVFWQRDPDGMQACLEGREVPPWDVVEALLQDLATEYGHEAAEPESHQARALHAEALAAFDARPGGRDDLGDRLDVMLREQRYTAERQAELSRRLAAATTQESADAIRLDLAWAHDDHERATARCAELRRRMERLGDRSVQGQAQAIRRGRAGGRFRIEAEYGPGATGGAEGAAHGSDRNPSMPRQRDARTAAEAAGPQGGPQYGAAPDRDSRRDGPQYGETPDRDGWRGSPYRQAADQGGWRDGQAAGPEQTPEAAWGGPDGGRGPGGRGRARADGARGSAGPDWQGAGAPGAATDPASAARADWHGGAPADGSHGAPAHTAEPRPFEAPDPGAADTGGPAAGEHVDAATVEVPSAPEPAPEPAPKQRKRRRGSARFAGIVEEEAAPVVVPPTVVPTLPAPAGRRRTPRGARFAGAADEPVETAEPQAEALGAADGREVVRAVEALVRLRAEGRSGEAHALLVEAAHWPAARFPLLAGELQRAGLGHDWATLLWEAASLPAERLVAAADALTGAGRGGDGEQILRQGVARPAEEIGTAVLGLLGEGRRREVRALLDAYVRVRTPEEAARSAAPGPQTLVPLLLEAARGVSEDRRWDLVHALRVAGFTA
ncbi:hypothetical protein [Streptomyces sp. S.PB5]|uniref:hypothetical protein n=1 Tax=Streptomyces sp. S.PB5 TaxID=3020844 RepID=UPI0025B0FE34|nr:hypothetical protein [Streptomyces sp. S.PB5]MDN3021859.1 hypothetical protein [Streptomyces sp. S.PB5]